MESNYPKAYREVIEILKYVSKESRDKIPKNMIEIFNAKMDKDYEFFIDINKNFENQDLLDETKAILANIFRDYWATPSQKEKIITKERNDRQNEEIIKRKMYNPDEIFGQRAHNSIDSNLPMEIKKEKFYLKIINYFKKIFKLI